MSVRRRNRGSRPSGRWPRLSQRSHSPRRRLLRFLHAGLSASVVTAVVSTLLITVSAPAEALIGTVIPMNGVQDPIDEIREDDALFAFVTADLVGGKVCVVAAEAPDPNADNRSCSDPEWGRPQDVSTLGSIIIPLVRPNLRIGTWRLLGQSPGGKVFSNEFTVTACPDSDQCTPSFGHAAVLEWKAAVNGPAEFAQSGARLCAGLELIDTATNIVAGGRLVANQSDFLRGAVTDSFSRSGYSVAVFNKSQALVPQQLKFALEVIADIPTSVPSLLLKIVRVGACRAAAMFKRMVADPPDANYQQVAEPEIATPPTTQSVQANRVMETLASVTATGDAQLHAYERYLGASAAASAVSQHLQASAAAKYGFQLVDHMRDAAVAMREYADVLD